VSGAIGASGSGPLGMVRRHGNPLGSNLNPEVVDYYTFVHGDEVRPCGYFIKERNSNIVYVRAVDANYGGGSQGRSWFWLPLYGTANDLYNNQPGTMGLIVAPPALMFDGDGFLVGGDVNMGGDYRTARVFYVFFAKTPGYTLTDAQARALWPGYDVSTAFGVDISASASVTDVANALAAQVQGMGFTATVALMDGDSQGRAVVSATANVPGMRAEPCVAYLSAGGSAISVASTNPGQDSLNLMLGGKMAAVTALQSLTGVDPQTNNPFSQPGYVETMRAGVQRPRELVDMDFEATTDFSIPQTLADGSGSFAFSDSKRYRITVTFGNGLGDCLVTLVGDNALSFHGQSITTDLQALAPGDLVVASSPSTATNTCLAILEPSIDGVRAFRSFGGSSAGVLNSVILCSGATRDSYVNATLHFSAGRPGHLHIVEESP